MPFNDLHTDIIEIVFYVHVHVHQGSRRSLLLTCHRWHSVAINYTSLWRSILWCYYPSTLRNFVQCNTLRGLARLIARTGNTTFDLSLGWWPDDPTNEEIDHFIASVEPDWLSRCRSFTLTANQTYVYGGKIGGLFLRGSFDGLERFTWHHPVQRFFDVELSRLIDHIGTTAPHLRDLEVACLPRTAPALSQLFCILRRILRLKILCTVAVPALWKHLTNIEHLDAVTQRPLFSILPSPNLTSLVLHGYLEPSMLPPTEILEKLIRLTIRTLGVPGSDKTSLFLPSVEYLACQFAPYLSYSGTLHAEKLKELTLVDTSCAQAPILRFGSGVAPRIVNMYTPYYGLYQLQSLSHPFWIKVVEFHVTVCKDKPRIAATITAALAARGFAPQLSCLTVRYETRGNGCVTRSQKQEWVDQLLRLMAGRVANGTKPFERLEVGWFNQLQYGYTLDGFTETEWVTHWTDCLRA